LSGDARQISRKLRITDRAAALLRTLHPHLKKKIRASFQAIMGDPYVGKALREELSGLRSFRVSRYRVIYRLIQERQIEIVAVGPRERIYEDTYRMLSKEGENKR
jgi:mRNA interferase RelE/StbE